MTAHKTTQEATDWLSAGRSIATERTVNGNVTVVPISRDATSRYLQRCSLEGVNPFRQDEAEIRWQAYKAGHLSMDEAIAN